MKYTGYIFLVNYDHRMQLHGEGTPALSEIRPTSYQAYCLPRKRVPLPNTTVGVGRASRLNEGVLRRAGEPLTSGVSMQRLPRERSDPLLVRRKGLALLLSFRGIPQPYFTLLIRGREPFPFANTKQRGGK